jgi:hypothetical protein
VSAEARRDWLRRQVAMREQWRREVQSAAVKDRMAMKAVPGTRMAELTR